MELCFISYARNNNLDGHLKKFVEKLKAQLPGHLPHGTQESDVAFFDESSISTGQDWMDRLSSATRNCRVCICFYSLPYFTSEYSGREVQVFLERIRRWEQQPGNAGIVDKGIIPVIWIPHDPIPPALSRFQTYGNMPKHYVNEGLHSLAVKTNRRVAYQTVLDELTKLVARTLQTVNLPQGPPILSFDALASAFHDPAPVRYGAAAILLTTPEQRVRPFSASASALDAIILTIAERARIPIREIRLAGDVAADILLSIQGREIPFVVADRDSLNSPLNAPLLAKIADSLDVTSSVVVFGDPSPNAAEAAAGLVSLGNQKFTTWKSLSAANTCVAATDTEMLASEIERRLVRARQDLLASEEPQARAEAPSLEAAALASGIPTSSQPILDSGTPR